MIYTLDGVEIQYRECQVLRDTAKAVLQERDGSGGLSHCKREWIAQMERLAEQNSAKRRYAAPLVTALQRLPEDIFEAVSEYAEFLVKKGRGIDIMVPFVAENSWTIMPVNVHEGMENACTED